MATVTSLNFDITSGWSGDGVDEAQTQLAALKAQIDDLNSQKLQISADTAEVNAQIAEIKQQIDSIKGQVGVTIDDAEASAQIDALKAQLASLGSEKIQLNVDKTNVDAAIAQIKVEMDAIQNKTIKITADTSAARSDIDSAAADMDDHIKSTSSSWDNMTQSGRAASFSLVSALATIGVALLPVAGAALSLGGALVSGFSSAGIAGAAYGGVVESILKSAISYNTTSGTLNQTLAAQKAQLSQLTPGSSAYKSQLDAISQTQSQLNQLTSQQLPIVVQVSGAITTLKDSWKSLVDEVAGVVGPQILKVLEDISASFKYLPPIIDAVAQAVQPLIDKFTAFAVTNPGDGIQKFVDWIIDVGVPNLKNIIQTIENLFTTLIQIASQFSSEGLGLTATLAKVTGELAKWGADGGFSRFAEQVRTMMPEIKQFFDGLGGSIVKLTSSIWDMGPASLSVLGTMLDLIAKLPVGVIQAFIVAFAAYKTVAAAATAFYAVETAVNAVKVAMTAAREVVLGFGAAEAVAADDSVALKIGMMAQAVATGIASAAEYAFGAAEVVAELAGLPVEVVIGAIIVAVAAIGFAIYELVDHWTTVWNAIKSTAETVWNALKTAFSDTVNFIKQYWSLLILALGPVGWLVDIGTHWNQVWNGIKVAAVAVWDALKVAFTATINGLKTAWDTVSGAISGAWNSFWNGLKVAAMAVWDALKVAWNAEVTGWKAIWDTVSGAISSAWNTFWNGLKTIASAIWTQMQVDWNAFINGLKTIWDTVSGALSSTWNTFWNGVKTIAGAIWNQMQTDWDTFINGLKTIWDTISGALSSAWNTFWNGLKTIVEAIWTQMQADWDTFWNGVKATYDTISGALSSAWDTFWNAVKTVAEDIWTQLKTDWDTFWNGIQSTYQTISDAISSAWDTFWNAVKTVAEDIWNQLKTDWDTFWSGIQSTYQTISDALQSAWTTFWNAVKTVADDIWTQLKTDWDTFWNGIQSTYQTVSGALQSAWNTFWNAVKTVADDIWTQLKTDFDTFMNGIKSTYDTISSALTTAWNNTWNTLKSALTSFVSDATSVWKGLQTAFEAPIHFVIDTVLNGGIIKAINWVIGKLGGSSTAIPDIPLPFAEGGHVRGAGTGTSDSIHAMLSNGEYVMPAHRTAEIGVNNLDAMRSGRMPHFVTGGVVGSGSTGSESGSGTAATSAGLSDDDLESLFEDLVKTVAAGAASVAGDAAGVVGDAAGAVAGAAKTVAKANIPVVSAVAGFLGGGASDVQSAADTVKADLLSWGQAEFDKGTDGVINLITSKLLPGIPGGSPVFGAMAHGAADGEAKQTLTHLRDDMSKFMFGQQQKQVAASIGAAENVPGDVTTWIAQGMAIAGVSGANWTNGLTQIAMNESGGNPNAVNNYDSNAQAGHPSQGLMQFIQPTFDAYAMPGYTDWMNPIDQVVADAWAGGYINKAYGGIGNVPGLKSISSGGGYVGYDTGGPLPQGLTLVNNTTGTMEAVLNPTGLAAIGGMNNVMTLNSGRSGTSMYQPGSYSSAPAGSTTTNNRSNGDIELNVTIVVPTATTADPQEVVDAVTEQLIPELTAILNQHAGG